MAKTVLMVDDEATQLRIMESVVSRMGYRVRTASDGDEAVHILLNKGGDQIDLLLLDLSMPRMGGIEVLQKIRPSLPALPVIVLTAHSSLSNVVEAMQAGANDFISKPASAEKLRTAINAALANTTLVGEIDNVTEAFEGENGFDALIGSSPAIQESIRMARKAARANIPVLIEGESGVGKEMFARAIHNASPRAGKPFIAVNCGAIPENLVESILFGHEKGAFTGASDKHVGKFQEASGGTLFLDEVGELPLDIQVKLLRAIQESEVDPVGASAPIKVDIRLISATNSNLSQSVKIGDFREDLYYRLNVFPLSLPPLRNRTGDIPALASHFVKVISTAENLPANAISSAAVNLLTGYHWPGNIRQLQNAIFRAVVMCEGDQLSADDFAHIISDGPSASAGMPPQGAANAAQGVEGALTLIGASGHVRNFAEMEREIIQFAINHHDGKMSEIARCLGIGRSTLYRKLDEYGLENR